MTGHTPGPWRVKYDGDIVDDHKDVQWPWRIVAVSGAEIADLVECDTSEDDARLIAAAPELLEALHGLSGLLADVETEPELDSEILRAIFSARTAIAKATGADR